MNYGFITYTLVFIKDENKDCKMKANKVHVWIGNHQVSVHYNDDWHKVALYRIIDNEEHETLSLINYYQSMGYKMIEYRRARLTLASEKERFNKLEKGEQ